MKKILILIASTLMFVACANDEDSSEERWQPAKRTVMVYMAAENSLSGNTQADITEMIRGMKSVSKYDNLLVFVDRASSREKPFVARIQNNAQQPVDTIMKYESDFYASDPDRMREVMEWMMTNYPAEDYGLVLWGHGNGWIVMDSVYNRAIAVDNGANTTNDTGRWMNIPSLREVLGSLPYSLKFIFADCCNMQNVEVAYELKDVTEYYIASPAGIPGEGAPYETIIPDLFIYDDVQMYTKVCDDYNALIDYENGHLPISVVSTKSLKTLATATKEVLKRIDLTNVNTDGLIYYYRSTRYEYAEEHVMYDMNDFLLRHAKEEDYQTWRKAFDDAIVYKKFSARWQVLGSLLFDFEMTEERYGGISMFVPLERYQNTRIKYNDLIKQMAWYHAVGWSELGW